jgi:hypothetical protein
LQREEKQNAKRDEVDETKEEASPKHNKMLLNTTILGQLEEKRAYF